MNSAPDIRDIKGLVPVPGWPGWVWALGVLAALGLGALAVWWWRRRHRAAPPAPAALPVRVSPVDAALAALRQLRADNPPTDEFYTRLSAIVRQYLEGRFRLRAPERTTEEFLQEAAREPRLTAAQRELLGAFLTEADLVKFAKHQPTAEDRARALAAAETVVEETRT